MENNFEYQNSTKVLSNSFVANVFMWMFVALGITALTAYLFGTSESLFKMLISEKPNGSVTMSLLGWIVMLSPFLIILVMSFGAEKMSASTMVLLYLVYSILMGMSLSFIFWAYTSASIFKTFIITSGMFGIMAIVGYTTNTDLTKFGSILLMALFGIIIASLVNFFMHSAGLDYIISIAGVIIFTGLTAYDVQKIKQIGMTGLDHNETMVKITIFAALNLYLDFLNLFLYLLRFFGKRN
ncbi:MAG: Bax inhibitor-1/YccA family protein [Bacteroidales bacterium]|nr:Bax inhibitor-1/YccA family protein [Bacteroidales bacterium]